MMNEQLDSRSDKRFWTLFMIWFTAGLLPLLISACESYTQLLLHGMNNAVSLILDVIIFICSALTGSVLVYIAARYPFRRCLPLLAFSAMLSICWYLSAAVVYWRHKEPIPYLDMIALLAVSVLAVAASIALVRLFSGLLKEEPLIVLCSLAAFFVLALLTTMVNGLLLYAVHSGEYIKSGFPFSEFFVHYLPNRASLLKNAEKVLLSAVGYLLLVLVFADNINDLFQSAAGRVNELVARLREPDAK